jgi:hypothetical protein
MLFCVPDVQPPAPKASPFWPPDILRPLAFEALPDAHPAAPRRVFFLDAPKKALCSVFAGRLDLTGLWLRFYDKLIGPALILRDSHIVRLRHYLPLRLRAFSPAGLAARFWRCLRLILGSALLFRLTAAACGLAARVRRHAYVMLVGLGDRAQRLGHALERSARFGIRIRGLSPTLPPPRAKSA